jgi:hypothetical protein
VVIDVRACDPDALLRARVAARRQLWLGACWDDDKGSDRSNFDGDSLCPASEGRAADGHLYLRFYCTATT